MCLLDCLEVLTIRCPTTLIHSTYQLELIHGKAHLSHCLFADLLLWRDQVEPPLHDLSSLQKREGAVRREKLLLGEGEEVKLRNLTFVNVLSPPLDLSQSFSLGRSYPKFGGLGSPFSDPMKSGAPG